MPTKNRISNVFSLFLYINIDLCTFALRTYSVEIICSPNIRFVSFLFVSFFFVETDSLIPDRSLI